jgi:hypothetical protein
MHTSLQGHADDSRHAIAHALLEAANAGAGDRTAAKNAQDNDAVLR